MIFKKEKNQKNKKSNPKSTEKKSYKKIIHKKPLKIFIFIFNLSNNVKNSKIWKNPKNLFIFYYFFFQKNKNN